jgi:hypothetical protein
VCADFGKSFVIPVPNTPVRRRVIYFPGSTIGNFEAPDALSLLQRIAAWAGVGGGLRGSASTSAPTPTGCMPPTTTAQASRRRST